MTLLELVVAFCERTGLPIPTAVIGTSDDQVLQIKGLMNELLDDLTNRKTVTFNKAEASFTTVATELQGVMANIATQGFMHQIVDSTMYNRTTGQLILGPVSPERWQKSKAGMSSISQTQYRLRDGNLYLTPAPEADQTVTFEYKSSFAVQDSGGTAKQYFTEDTDTCCFPDALMIAGLRWTWKREKGLRYAELFRNYEVQVANLLGYEGGANPVNLSQPSGPVHGIITADQSWDL